ncbi:hypothetical protein [Tabrizicola sp.]|uniref:hypothetical protein n=1 Tax=Tabrizicola sp. TaxID=2005166 RepID=UPI002869F773|nr:hypothetical protein [Tabrizicola sp.]
MDRKQFEAWDRRIITRADRLWQAAGRPEGARDSFTEAARELIAIEENPDSGTLDPEDTAKPVIEEASIMRNLGEFPTLTDQGEEMTFPDTAEPDFADDDGIHLSDGDASDSGGVLPLDDMPLHELADISVADADITSDTTDADNEPPSAEDDLNDDGLPDQPAFGSSADKRSE